MPMAKKATTTTNAPVAATPSVGQAVEPAKAVNKPADYGTPKSNKKDASYYVMNGYGKPMSQYEIDRDQRISKAGIIQSVVQSPGLATVPFKTRTDFVKLVKETAQELLDWVNEGI